MSDDIRQIVAYHRNFQQALEQVAADALSDNPILAAVELASLYTPADLVCGMQAADECGLTVEEGVFAFTLLRAAVAAEGYRRTFWDRIRIKFAPKPGSSDSRHVAMVNQASLLLEQAPATEKDRGVRPPLCGAAGPEAGAGHLLRTYPWRTIQTR